MNSLSNNYYALVMDKQTAEKLTEQFSRFYATEHTKDNLDRFISSFFGDIAGKNIPWLDLPFYINSIQRDSVPKALRTTWRTRGLAGGLDLTPEKRAEMSVEFFIRAKRDMIKRYVELLEIYLKTKEFRPRLMTLEEAAKILLVPADEVRQILDNKGIPLYAITPNSIRLTEDDFTLFLANCRLRPNSFKSEIVMPEDKDSNEESGRVQHDAESKGQQPKEQSQKDSRNRKKNRDKNQKNGSQQRNGQGKGVGQEKKPFVPPVVQGNNLADFDDVGQEKEVASCETKAVVLAEQPLKEAPNEPEPPASIEEKVVEQAEEQVSAEESEPQKELGASAAEEKTDEVVDSTETAGETHDSVPSVPPVMQPKQETDCNDCLSFFKNVSLGNEDAVPEEEELQFTMGNNRFSEEVSSQPPTSPSYRNRSAE